MLVRLCTFPFTLGPFLDLSCTPRSNSFCELKKITLRRRIHSIPLTASKVSPPRRSKRSAHIMYKRPPNATSSRLHPVSLFYDFWCSSPGPPAPVIFSVVNPSSRSQAVSCSTGSTSGFPRLNIRVILSPRSWTLDIISRPQFSSFK